MTFSPLQLGLLFLIGCLAGFMNVVAGGGSMIAMPVLRIMGLSGPMANGTNRIAVLFQNLTASASYCRQKVAEPKLSFTLGLCALPGTLVGAYFGTELKGALFNYVLAGVMIFVLAYMIFSQQREKRRRKEQGEVERNGEPASPTSRLPNVEKLTRKKSILGHLSMFFVGLYGGFLQAGVGIVIMACLNGVLDMPLVRANIHKVFIIGLYTIVAVAVFAYHGDIYWTAGICLACGNSLGAVAGTRVNLRGGDRIVRIILYLVIIAMAGRLIWQTF